MDHMNNLMRQVTSLFFLIVVIAAYGGNRDHTSSVYDLRCENMDNPLGIDKLDPRFSWKIESRKNGTSQKAFQIVVASDLSRLSEKRADLWNSGKIDSSASLFVPYQGHQLNSGTAAWWMVRIWDETGNMSSWSEPARFTIGLLDETEWEASYIACNSEKGYRECPQLFSTFEVADTDAAYLLHVNSLGYHEVYINGERVGNGVLAPAVSQFDKRSLINTYDITSLLKKGENDLILWLGSGWYTEGLPGVVHNGPVVRAQLEKVENNSSEVVLATDQTWKGRKSSYTRHGNWRPHQFGGEIVEGAMARSDLKTHNPENPWKPVTLIDVPAHQATPQITEQNSIVSTITPVSVNEIAPDTFLVDMGTNLTGWVEIDFPKLQTSQEVKIDYCDFLLEENHFNDQNLYDKYIASGEGTETFANKFNYHGFRYMRITGLQEIPKRKSIKAHLIRTGFESASSFECSDSDLNAIHDMVHHTLQCLSIGGDFVDCPQLERLGYGGDGNASTLTAQTMFNLGPLYNNWLQTWADVIREDGGMPHTAPNPYNAGGGPYWCGFIITASWQSYMNYGDSEVLERYYPVMQQWLGYVEKHQVNGLLKQWPDTDYRNWYLGDWATPAGIDQTDESSVDLVNNAFIAVCFDRMQQIAQILGKAEDATRYASQKKALQKLIHDTFFDETNNTYGTGTQIDLAFPMIAGVVSEDKLHAVEQSLYDETEVNRDGHLATGLVGLPVITEWIVRNGAVDLMYSMLKKRDYPGFLYMIDNGATTTWEHWNGERSHIHNCYNAIGSWFYQAVGGILPAENVPGYRKIRIHPQIPVGVTWAKTTKETPYGTVVVNWTLNDHTMEMEIEIPVGSEAEVTLPEEVKAITINGIEQNISGNSKKSLKMQNGRHNVAYNITQ
ncbi:MAG: alpha-rhamnosidase [Verrucomicrobiae bacterium]|nr:alpha-rhamnosidase [Verrucomicrobiae bacterium]